MPGSRRSNGVRSWERWPEALHAVQASSGSHAWAAIPAPGILAFSAVHESELSWRECGEHPVA